MSPSSCSSNSTRPWKHDVFLSFRGKDTRDGFTDLLCHDLQQKGINTFIDEEKLEIGEDIDENLHKAIEESFSAIIILSRNYASSTWCLDELTKILQCRKEFGLQVYPVFYGVTPSQVRHQKGNFARAFKRHDERFSEDDEEKKVQKWRDTFKQVANLCGWNSKDWRDRELKEIITEEVWSKIKLLRNYDSNIEKMSSFVAKEKEDVSDKSQLDTMAGVKEWFSAGTKVIITPQNMYLLTSHGMAKCGIKIISQDEYLQLFCQKAFKGGLLALNVLGSPHRVRKICECECEPNDISFDESLRYSQVALDLEQNDILNKLKISCYGSEGEKNKFRDIPYFFKDMDEDFVNQILKSSGFESTIGVKVVTEKSIIIDGGGQLWKQESIVLKDIDVVVSKNKGREAIQHIVLKLPEAHWELEAFSNMRNNRFLIISQNFDKLKFVDLNHSIDQIQTPNFVEIPNSEEESEEDAAKSDANNNLALPHKENCNNCFNVSLVVDIWSSCVGILSSCPLPSCFSCNNKP